MFQARHEFYYSRSKQRVAIKKDIKSAIIKAAIISASRHECKDDYVLIIQFRSDVLIKSLKNPNYENPLHNATIISEPFIIIPKIEKPEKKQKAPKVDNNKKKKTIKPKVENNDSIYIL